MLPVLVWYPLQFFETVVLRNLRPMIPQGMPADYQLLMEHCWATDPEGRPSVERLLECLKFMIRERQDADELSSSSGLPHSKSAPSPMALLKQLPDKRKQVATDTPSAAADNGFADAVFAPANIHNSFSGLILGPEVAVDDVGSNQLLPQELLGTKQQQSHGASNVSLSGGHLGASISSTTASTAGLPPRPAVRPVSAMNSSSNPGWTVPPEQAWFV
jgi:hypothetical protein